MATTFIPDKVQRVRQSSGDRMFASDDNAIMKQIHAIHVPDGRDFDVKPLLRIVENILIRTTSSTTLTPALPGIPLGSTQAQLDALEDKTLQDGSSNMIDLLAHTINKISCEISCKCTSGGEAHATAVAVFNILSSYSWDAKVVLALAAFATTYGEFWLVALLYPTNPLAKSVAILKQLPDILEHTDALKPKFEALSSLIKVMVDVAKCIVQFKELPPQYITPDTPEMVTAIAHIPTAVYWTIRSIVACASQIASLIGMSHEYIASTMDAWELSGLAHKVSNMYGHLQSQLNLCQQHINDKKHIEAYMMLVRLFEIPHSDNMKIIRVLIYAKDDQPPLFDGLSKRKVSLDILRRKNVLLFISELEVPNEELFILDQMFQESRQDPTRPESQYEVVWMPVVDRSTPWTEEKNRQFEALKAMMPWYSVDHPSSIDLAVIKYIKEMWGFNKKPLLVVLDPQGRVVNNNAIHMMWIWGSVAFPFTSLREEGLWKGETWRMELLADTIDPIIHNWISEGRYICLFGGEDMEWIRKFCTLAKAVARAAGIRLEMLYVGKSNPREKIQKINAIISTDNLGHILPDLHLVWFFWVRLESMWYSKMQHGKTVENDPIMQEIVSMLSFDGSDQGWVVFSKGSGEMTKAKGENIVRCLSDYDVWKNNVLSKGFLGALNDYLREIHTPHHCNRLILPGTTGSIPERVVCAECGRPMEKFVMYRCCRD
ncbi:hypothetical protein PVL29_000655 [Vitis rotundifolia]|uniref:Protein SIEVE ELEMENT OCCLUSION B-like n=2 Tax=Vitis rotundifolia TaxID=103349 RepID=A0AA39E517_VITRO|nr:hypothetical protein PVL29_000655 [Vitis rotundifolia]